MARGSALAALAGVALALCASAGSPEDAVIRSAVPWYDTDGNRMYAGGANMYEENGTYYLVGEGKKVLGADCSECFNLYSSSDLSSWTFESCLLNNSNIVAPPPFNNEPFYRMERPKILKCPGTGQYVMWFHCDTSNFAMRSVGVLTADSVTGPYTFAAPCFKPDGQDSYDMGTFVDSTGDGRAYLIRSVRNQFAGISQMTEDCLNVTGIISNGPDMEGQALMRDANGTLHAAGSHLTGWNPNPAQFVTTPNTTLVGAVWENNINPSGDATTYDSQSTFIFPYTHADGHKTFIWMADRWNANGPGGLDNMTLIWLPLQPSSGKVEAGSTVLLAQCDATDAGQQFSIGASGAITHVASGLCVTQPGSGVSAPIVLGACVAGAANQTWSVTASGTISNNQPASSKACVDWNVANNDWSAGNTVIEWNCGNPPNANELWIAPAAGAAAGLIQARAQSGGASGLCASVQARSWVLPWYDAWSLKDF